MPSLIAVSVNKAAAGPGAITVPENAASAASAVVRCVRRPVGRPTADGRRDAEVRKRRVTATAEGGGEPGRPLARGGGDARGPGHAWIMPQADGTAGGTGWPDGRIAEALDLDLDPDLDVGLATVRRLRRRLVEEGLAAASSPCRGGERLDGTRLDGGREARSIARACSTPPDGNGRWARPPGAESSRSMSTRSRARRRAKCPKNQLRPHLGKVWCVPPRQS